jgi:acetate---CoA ligase (ADP-forming) subunit beta
MSGIRSPLEEARKNGRTRLLEPEAKAVCIEYGIPVARFLIVQNVDEALQSADAIGYPVVLKVVSHQIIHKSDVGGVVVGLRNAVELRAAYRNILEAVRKNMPTADVTGMLVEEMLPSSTEVVVGATKNPQFGHVIMFGLGGVFVEVLKDVSFRAAPIHASDAREMITELKAFPILGGYRGKPPADIGALVDILLKTSKLVTDHPEIGEVDLNPILVSEKGAKAVDARIVLGAAPVEGDRPR